MLHIGRAHGVAAHFSSSPSPFAGSLRPSFPRSFTWPHHRPPTSIADGHVLYHDGLLPTVADFGDRQHAVLVGAPSSVLTQLNVRPASTLSCWIPGALVAL